MADISWPQVLRTLISHSDLSHDESSWAMQQMLAGEAPQQKGSGLSPREWRELRAVLGRET